MKTLQEILNELSTVSSEHINEVVDNENIDTDTVTEAEKFSVLVYEELAKALRTEDHELLLDANYAKSGMHGKSDPDKNRWLVDYYRLVTSDSRQKSLIQFYVRANPKKGTCVFNLCTSCAEASVEQFENLHEVLKFTPRKSITGRCTTTYRNGVSYDEIVETVKSVCAVLANSQKKSKTTESSTEEE